MHTSVHMHIVKCEEGNRDTYCATYMLTDTLGAQTCRAMQRTWTPSSVRGRDAPREETYTPTCNGRSLTCPLCLARLPMRAAMCGPLGSVTLLGT